MVKQFYALNELSEAELFAMHLAFARETGLFIGTLPVDGGRQRLPGIHIDPRRQETADFLATVPRSEWKRKSELGIAELSKKGIMQPRQGATGAELIDRYTVDYSRVVSATAVLAKDY